MALSTALSPLWIWFYCSEQFDIDIVAGQSWIVRVMVFAIPLMLVQQNLDQYDKGCSFPAGEVI